MARISDFDISRFTAKSQKWPLQTPRTDQYCDFMTTRDAREHHSQAGHTYLDSYHKHHPGKRGPEVAGKGQNPLFRHFPFHGRVQRQTIGGAPIQKVEGFYSIFGFPRRNHKITFGPWKKILKKNLEKKSWFSQLSFSTSFFLTWNSAQEWSRNAERGFTWP